MNDSLSCKKIKIGNKEYIRIDDDEPIWFMFSEIKKEYETSYNSTELEKVYLENLKND